MTPTEAVDFTEFVSALWPQQRLEDATPDAWFAAGLKDVDPADAKHAATRLASLKTFISLAELLTEVKALRSERLERTPLPAPPTDDADGYREMLRRDINRIAGGWSIGKALAKGQGTEPGEDYLEARGEDPKRRELRVGAMTVQCPRCGVLANERCESPLGEPLSTQPAHDARLVAAGLAVWVEVNGQQRATLVDPGEAS